MLSCADFAGAGRADLRSEHRTSFCHHGLPAISLPRRLSPASNTAPRSSAPRRSWCWVTPIAGRSRPRSKAKRSPGRSARSIRYIRPAVDQAGLRSRGGDQGERQDPGALLRQSSPVLAEHIKQNRLKIVAGYYDLAAARSPGSTEKYFRCANPIVSTLPQRGVVCISARGLA